MHPLSPSMEYMQATGEPGCVICSLSSALHASGDVQYAKTVYGWLEESITMPFAAAKKRKRGNNSSKDSNNETCMDRFDHVVNRMRRKPRKYDPHVKGLLEKYEPPYHEDVILCLLGDSRGGRGHAVSLWNGWIFDSNISYAIPFCDESLNWCCSDEEGQCGFSHVAKTIRCVPSHRRKTKLESSVLGSAVSVSRVCGKVVFHT